MIAGRGPSPYEVLLLIQRLPDDSLTSALASGDRSTFGWGTDRHLAADLYDAINQTTRAAGNWGKKGPPKIPAWPRPVHDVVEQAKPKSVADLYKRFQPK